MADELIKETCNHPGCGQTDDHPKFRIYVDVKSAAFGVGAPVRKLYHEHDVDKDGYLEYHHDCAASLPGEEYDKARVMIEHIGDAKGDELRALLMNPNHPVHEAVRAHSRAQSLAAEAERLANHVAAGLA